MVRCPGACRCLGDKAVMRQRGRPKEYLRVIASKKRPGARIRLAVRRCFITHGRLVTVRQVLDRAYPRLRRFTSWHYLAARRALRQSPVSWRATGLAVGGQLCGAQHGRDMKRQTIELTHEI